MAIRRVGRFGRGGDRSDVTVTLTPRMSAMLAGVAATTGSASRTEVLRRAIALFVWLQGRATTHDIVLRDRTSGMEELVSLATRAELAATSPAAVQAASAASRRTTGTGAGSQTSTHP